MANVGQARETLEDLYRTPGKAELIDGRIVHYMATGFRPHRIALRITMSLEKYSMQGGQGVACGDNLGFVVPELPSGRESFSPDAAYYTGPLPANPMRFIEGAPTLAVEVRSENDYGPAAEDEMAAKRVDYFSAGTAVVWDVDPVAECIHVYHPSDPAHPTTCRRGQFAEAEAAAPGWQVAVDEIFAP
jgi:Uma2 family endonuclease